MIYELAADRILEDLVKLEPGTFDDISLDCRASRFERLSKEPIEVSCSERGGTIFPDYFFCDDVPMFSEYAYSLIKKQLQKNIFLRDVFISSPIEKEPRKYKIVLPRKIDCVERKKSVLRPVIPGNPASPLRAQKLVIDEEMLGDAVIFKLSGISDNRIFIQECVKEKLSDISLKGIDIYPLEDS